VPPFLYVALFVGTLVSLLPQETHNEVTPQALHEQNPLRVRQHFHSDNSIPDLLHLVFIVSSLALINLALAHALVVPLLLKVVLDAVNGRLGGLLQVRVQVGLHLLLIPFRILGVLVTACFFVLVGGLVLEEVPEVLGGVGVLLLVLSGEWV